MKDTHGMKYLMESEDETLRLDIKTEDSAVRRQALWAGIKPGMRVADVCCGSGKTTYILQGLVKPGGTVMGIDGSQERIDYAGRHYGAPGIEFVQRDILKPLDELGAFDFVWVRFVLEYFSSRGMDVIKNISSLVKPGGTLCLIDLDHNCLAHFGLPQRLERTIAALIKTLQENADFDPYAGRKLYSYLYRLGYQDINVDISTHHLIYGDLTEKDVFNWSKKVEVASRKINYRFEEYEGGYGEFLREFKRCFADPGRFLYTPLLVCIGRKPFSA